MTFNNVVAVSISSDWSILISNFQTIVAIIFLEKRYKPRSLAILCNIEQQVNIIAANSGVHRIS